MILRARPLYRSEDATVDTAGTAFAVAASTTQPVTTHQIIVEIVGDSRAFVGVGRDATPPAPTANNTVYQAANTERVYTFDGQRDYEQYLYVYAVSGTIEAYISRFG